MNWLRRLRSRWLIRTRLTDAGLTKEAARLTALAHTIHDDEDRGTT